MAANNILSNHLQNVFGCNQELAQAIHEQGIVTTCQLMNAYNDEGGIESLCKRIVEPGGMIPDPAWVPDPAANPVPPHPLVRNRGTRVTIAQQNLLTRLAFYCQHRHHVQRLVALNHATLLEMDMMGRLITQEKDLKRDEETLMLDKFNPKDNIWKVLDSVEGYLAQIIGSYGAPLTYVIRKNVAVDDTITL
jgi:hypothetical protein